MNVKPSDFELKAYALIRDKNGKPKIDNYQECHESIKALLTQTEREEFENGTNTR